MLDRAGVTLIKIYNEGLSVFLYDEANYESIRKAVPAILFDSNEDPHEDRALKKLAAEGKLVVYELRQDDSLHIEVVVGGRLTKKEMRGAKWHKPQTAPLSLPSGTLFIDSYNSLRLLPEEKPYEKGGTVKVKPGNYVLTLHRIDWDQMGGTGYNGPSEVITLTPAGKTKTIKSRRPILTYLDEKHPAWAGKYKMADNEFRGLSLFPNSDEKPPSLAVNLDKRATERLRLHRNAHLQLVLDSGETYDLYYNADLFPLRYTHYFGTTAYHSLNEGRPGLLQAYIEVSRAMERVEGGKVYLAAWLLRLRPTDADLGRKMLEEPKFQRLFALPMKTPVTIRVLPVPYAPPPDTSWVGQWSVSKNELHCQVLISHDKLIALNCEADSLEKLGEQWGDSLELTVGVIRRRVLDMRGPGGPDLLDKEKQTRPENKEEMKRMWSRIAELTFKKKTLAAGDPEKLRILEQEEEDLRRRHEEMEFGPGVLESKPLQFMFRDHWDLPKRYILCATPLFPRYNVDLPAVPGTPAVLKVLPKTV